MTYSPKVSTTTLIARWSVRLADAELDYATNRTKETRAEYLSVLKIFTRLVVDNEIQQTIEYLRERLRSIADSPL
jgi:hypothetical protein